MARITGSDAKKLYELYDSIYEMKEYEHQEENFEHVLEEEDLQEYDVQGAVKGALDKGAKFMKTNPVGKAVSAVLKPAGKGRGTVTKAENEKRIQQNQDVDLFDLIKGHLIDEGYAETEEAALAIMANMTEEWRQSIVEGLGGMLGSAVSAAASALKDRMKSGTKRTGNINLPMKSGTKRTGNINLPNSRSVRSSGKPPMRDEPLWGPGSKTPSGKPSPTRKPPMRDEPLWGPGSKTPSGKPSPTRKPPMRDEPLW